MEQWCKNILQNYLNTQEYSNDYTITIHKYNINIYIIKYKNIILFYVYDYIHYLYKICNETKKEYKHYYYYYYCNNKNNKIWFYKKEQIKIIYNKEEKHYNKFCKLYKKTIDIYSNIGYYYSIKPYLYIYKTSINYYNKQKLYSNHNSIMFVII